MKIFTQDPNQKLKAVLATLPSVELSDYRFAPTPAPDAPPPLGPVPVGIDGDVSEPGPVTGVPVTMGAGFVELVEVAEEPLVVELVDDFFLLCFFLCLVLLVVELPVVPPEVVLDESDAAPVPELAAVVALPAVPVVGVCAKAAAPRPAKSDTTAMTDVVTPVRATDCFMQISFSCREILDCLG